MKRFNRFELKYILHASQAEDVKADLVRNMAPDQHGDGDGSYSLSSLYYDTADLAFMRSKVEGIKFRRKLRIRRYGEGEGGLVYVEIKQRISRTTQKRRLALPLSQAYRLCAGELDGERADADDEAVAQEIQFLARGLALQATTLVGYRRQAFVGSSYEPGLRVTFDRAMWGAIPTGGLAGETAPHALEPQTTVIMEVKANNAVPLWLANLLARHHCDLRRYSKYSRATRRLIDLELMTAQRPVSPEGAQATWTS